MKPRFPGIAALAGALIFALTAGAAPAETAKVGEHRFVAGTVPHQRPVGAPMIKEFAPGPGWAKTATTGVVEPLPASLKFLASQGAWYTPFTLPGMPGYYDLRQWHAPRAPVAARK